VIASINKFRNSLFGTIQAAVTSESFHPRDATLARLFGSGQPTHSGQRVSHDTAIAIPAIYRGVNIVSNAVANVPFYVFENDANEGQKFAKRHTSWKAIAVKPHKEIKTFDFIRTLTAWAMQWGNGIAHIHRPQWPLGGTVELTPLLPDRTRPVRINARMVKEYNIDENLFGELFYETEIGGESVAYHASDCVHIRGLGGNPYWGYDVVDLLVQALGGAQAKYEFGQRFYGQGANPAGFFEMQGKLDEESEKRFIESMRRGMEGMRHSHRIMLLEEGTKFNKWTIDPDKAQYIEGLEFDYRVLANILGIKVHKLIDGANSAYNSLEMAEYEHKSDDILPWVNQWKGEYHTKMLTERQQMEMTHSIGVDDEKLEGFIPFEQRVNGTVNLANNNLITRDEGRTRVNWGPSQDGLGRRHVMPLNHGFATDLAAMSQMELNSPTPQTRPEDTPPIDGPDDDPPADDPDGDNEERALIETGDASEDELQAETTADDGATQLLTEMRSAWVEKIQTRVGKQAVKLSAKDAGDFIAWVDRLSTETAPAAVQEDVDAFYAAAKTTFTDMINHPTTQDFNLAAAVAAEVDQWSGNEETEA
jgi:HK97 family phage portal protein